MNWGWLIPWKEQTIEPGHGIGRLKFGDSPEQVQKHLGEPNEIENLDEWTTFLTYNALELSLGFWSLDWRSEAIDKRLVTFMTGHRKMRLWGERIIGRSENEVIELFKERGYNGFTATNEILGPFNYRTLHLDQCHVTLDFRDGLLRRVLFGENDPNRKL